MFTTHSLTREKAHLNLWPWSLWMLKTLLTPVIIKYFALRSWRFLPRFQRQLDTVCKGCIPYRQPLRWHKLKLWRWSWRSSGNHRKLDRPLTRNLNPGKSQVLRRGSSKENPCRLQPARLQGGVRAHVPMQSFPDADMEDGLLICLYSCFDSILHSTFSFFSFRIGMFAF